MNIMNAVIHSMKIDQIKWMSGKVVHVSGANCYLSFSVWQVWCWEMAFCFPSQRIHFIGKKIHKSNIRDFNMNRFLLTQMIRAISYIFILDAYRTVVQFLFYFLQCILGQLRPGWHLNKTGLWKSSLCDN